MKKFQKVALVTALATLTATQVFAEEAAKEVMNDENVKVETKVDEKAEEAKDNVEEKAEEEKAEIEEKAEEEKAEVKEDAEEEKTEAKDAVDTKDIKLVINGKEVENTEEYASFVQENSTFVPIRLISEKLGFNVEWNDEAKDITVTNGDNKVVFNAEKDTYMDKDGKEAKMDVKPVVKNNRTFLPIRFVSEALDIEITWDEETRTVTVTQEEAKDDKEEAKEENTEAKEETTEDDKNVEEDKTVEETTEK